MAHLEVKPKKSTPWWVWLLLLIAAIAIVLFWTNRSTETDVDNRDSTDTVANIHSEVERLK